MAQLDEAAAVRRLADRMGFSLGGEDLRTAQQQGYAEAVRRFLRPTGTDRGAADTPPPELEPLERPARPQRKKRTNKRGEQPEDETGAPDQPVDEPAEPDRAAQRAYRRSVKEQEVSLRVWWLDRMAAADHATAEKLTWFWHGHFATSAQKVRRPAAVLAQNETFRRLGRGPFLPLAQAMITDPAMLIWLDGNDNTVESPNENLSREFLELFTLGHGHFTESDVQQGARALTGWRVDRRTGRATLRPARHDQQDKSVLGATGDLDAAGFVAAAVADPQCARFVTGRLWFRLVSDRPPSAAAAERLVAAYTRGGTIEVLAAITAEPAFRESTTSLVKQPVEWLVALLRALGLRLSAAPEPVQKRVLASLQGMGQQPFRPPSVGGWPAGGAWLTTAAARARVEAARALTSAAGYADQPPASRRARADQVQRLLGVDRFTARTRAAIDQVADKLPAAVAVAACSPEYVVSA